MKKLICFLIMLCLLSSSFITILAEEFSKSEADIIIKVGEKYTISTVLKYMTDQHLPTSVTIHWNSSYKNIATVSGGVVYGVSEGATTITATASNNGKNYIAQANVYVVSTVTDVKLNADSIDLKVGQSQKLVEIVYPSSAVLKTVTWKTEDSTVATVSSGTVKGIKEGYTYITVTTKDGNHITRCRVNVESTVNGIELDQHNLNKSIGESFTITAKILPDTAFLKDVKWTSNNTKAVTVSGGNAKALSKGVAVITAITVDGSYKDECRVVVDSTVTGVSLSKSTMEITKGSKETLTATVFPEDAVEKSVVWKSDDGKVATVSNGTVTGVGAGNTIISATTKDGGFESACHVTVISNDVPEKKVDKINLVDTDVTMNVGENKWFSYKVYPEDIIIPKLKVTITSSEGSGQNTAQIKNNLLYFEAKKAGDYSLILELAGNSKIFDVCSVHIKSMVTGIQLNKTNLSIFVGEKAQLTGIALPDTAIIRGVTFKSSDTKIAAVNSSTGEVQGISAGHCDITASTIDGNIKQTCSVFVSKSTDIESLKLKDTEGNIVGEKNQPAETQAENDAPDEEKPILITIDGTELKCDQPAVQVNDRVLAPVRAIFEGLGAKVEWDEKSQMVTGQLKDKVIQMYINKNKATVNGKTVELDVPAQLIGSRTMVPVRFISENLGVTVDWDETNRTVIIKSA